MNDFVFCSPTRFVFGRGVTDTVGDEVAGLGLRKVLLAYGQGSVIRTGTLDRVRASLDAAGVAYVEAGGARPNPEVGWVRETIELARSSEIQGVLAVGGGSVIDAAKAVAFGVPYEGDVWDFFAHKTPITACLPVASVLTIPAAGSEASGSCVISNDAEQRKLGVSGDVFRPRLAIMDPELTCTLPPYQTAAGVTDMIAHVCERYFSGVGAVPVTDGVACGIIRSLLEVVPRDGRPERLRRAGEHHVGGHDRAQRPGRLRSLLGADDARRRVGEPCAGARALGPSRGDHARRRACRRSTGMDALRMAYRSREVPVVRA